MHPEHVNNQNLSAGLALCRDAKIQTPILCGAMYPCSNWQLVAAVSKAGGMGIVQPISLVYAHKTDFREGLRLIKAACDGKPIGMNVITEKSSNAYLERMRNWVDIALEEGVRFFVTSLGNPRWIVDRVRPLGGVVYHAVTERKWAEKAIKSGVSGLIAVNDRAGGHAGGRTPAQLIAELAPLGLPVVCAGGVGNEADYVLALQQGYAGVQMGTRFIATEQCQTHPDYKAAILRATADDIVLTDKISGVPVAIIRTPYIDKVGAKAGPVARLLLRNAKTKHYMRMFYSLQSLWKLKKTLHHGTGYKDFWQAGKSVAGITAVESAGAIVARFDNAAQAAFSAKS